MKKLMIAAAAAVLTAGAFAAPAVYDFKATVKHTYLKPVTTAKAIQKIEGVNLSSVLPKGSKIYLKCTKSSTLKGYLVHDYDATCTNGTITAKDAQPGNRCFLVVQNAKNEKGKDSYSGAKYDYRMPRIIPGIIDVKWYNNKLAIVKSLPAQGYLYLGGEVVANADDSLLGTKFVEANYYESRKASEWVRNANELAEKKTAPFAIDDYFFTSCFLFGQYNQPSWNGDYAEEFADTWMNCAGLGKITWDQGWSHVCCGKGTTQLGDYRLDSLSGSLKAGIFLCTENGEDDGHGKGLSRTGLLEDQLYQEIALNTYYTEGDEGKVAVESAFNGKEINPKDTDYTYLHKFAKYGRGAAGTRACCDIWADGTLDLRTTDIGYGNWAIKYNSAASTAFNKDVISLTSNIPEFDEVGFPTEVFRVICNAFNTLNNKISVKAAILGNVLDGAFLNKEFVAAYFFKKDN